MASVTTLVVLALVYVAGVRCWDLPEQNDEPGPRTEPEHLGSDAEPSPTSTPSPSATIPTAWDREASFETSLGPTSTGDIDGGWRAYAPFQITRTNERGAAPGFGSYATRIVTNGGTDGCSCPRFTFHNLDYTAGEEVWIRGAWLVRNPLQLDNPSRLMSLTHWIGGSDDNYLVGLIVSSAGQMRVQVYTRANNSTPALENLSPSFSIPADRWFVAHLHMILSPTNGQALTELYLDGQLVSRNTTGRNMIRNEYVNIAHYGLPYFLPGPSATVYFDAAGLAAYG